MYENIKTLKRVLGKEKYEELLTFTYKRVEAKFGKQPKFITKKIVYANMSAVLIVGMVKDKSKLEDYLHLKQLNSNQYFIEVDVNKFVEVFSNYINLVEKWRNNR